MSCHSTVSEKVVKLCCELDVASMVTVAVEDDEADDPLIENPLPHPLSRHSPIRLTTSSSSKRHRFFQPKQHRTAPAPLLGTVGAHCGL